MGRTVGFGPSNYDFGALVLTNSTLLILPDASSTKNVNISLSDVVVDARSKISADGAGYGAGSGPGSGTGSANSNLSGAGNEGSELFLN